MPWLSYGLLFAVSFAISGAYFYVRGGEKNPSPSLKNWGSGPGNALIHFRYTHKLKTNFITGQPKPFDKRAYGRGVAKKTALKPWPPLAPSRRIRLQNEMPTWVRRDRNYNRFYNAIVGLNAHTYPNAVSLFYSIDNKQRRTLLMRLFRERETDPIVLRRLAIFIKYACKQGDVGLAKSLLATSTQEREDRMIRRYLEGAIRKWEPRFRLEDKGKLPEILR